MRTWRPLLPWFSSAVLLTVVALMATPADASEYSDLVISYGPEAYWRLGESFGGTAVDETGSHNGSYQNNISLGSAGAISGDSNTAADFGGGNNDRVQVPAFDVSGTGLTILAWFKPDNFGDDRFVSKAYGTPTNNHYWMLGINGNNRLRARVKINGNTRQLVPYVGTMSAGTWYFAALTYDGSTMRVFLNGTEVGSRNWSGSVSTSGATEIGLGNQPAGAGNRAFDGVLDELAVFDKALSPAQIAALYAAGQETLIGYWKLNQTGGTTAVDSSDYGQNGTVNGGANWSTRCNGVSTFDFNGSGNYISIPNAAHLQPTSALTIAGWIRGDSWSSGTDVDVIVRKGEGNPNNYQLAIADGRVALYLDDSDTNGIRGNTVLATDQWYHVAAAWDGTDVRIYVNGQLDNTPTSRNGTIGTDTRPVYIGGRAGTDYFDGMIYDVQFYNVALDQSQIEALFGLTGHWEFSEGTGTTAADSSGFGNDATLSGGASWITDCEGTSALLTNGAGGIAQTNSPFTPPDAGTVAFWMQSSGAPAGTARIFGLGGDWEARQSSDGTVAFDLCGDATPDVITTVPLDVVDRWYHVATTFDSSDDSYAIYIDGVLDKSGTNSNSMVQQAANLLSFGTRTGSTQYWQGGLRDFRVYDRILCPDEIAALASSYGLVGEWKLDETSGTVAFDSSPSGNDGTYRNGVSLASSMPVPVDGAVAAVFDGNNDYVSINNSSDYNITGPLTVAVWIRVSSFTKTWQAIFTKGDSAWRLSRNGNTNTIHFACTGLSTFRCDGSVNVNDGLWHHIVGVYDGSYLLLYVDGELDASVSSTGSINTNNYEVEIGENAQATGREFHGAIYDARVYDRALCPDEIQELYGGSSFEGVRILDWIETP